MFNFRLKERKNLKVLDLTRFQSSSRNNIYLLGSYTLLFLALKLNLIRKFNERMALKDNNLTDVMADHGFMRLGAKHTQHSEFALTSYLSSNSSFNSLSPTRVQIFNS